MTTDNKELEFFVPDTDTPQAEGVMVGSVKAGFPSPADDFPFTPLNLNDLLVGNPETTFFVRVSGYSMSDDGIDDGDILVVEKGMEPYNNCVAICSIDGEFTLKRVELHPDYALLVPANSHYRPIRVDADNDLVFWGVVKFVIRRL